MIKSDYIVFDCETGGLSEHKNPITQFACVILDGTTLKEIDRWETYVQPYANLTIEQQAIDHTQVTWSDVRSGVTLSVFVKTLTTFLEQHRSRRAKTREMGLLIAVGHNIPFDLRFLNAALELAGLEENIFHWLQPAFIDTYALGKMAFGVSKDRDEKLTLGACCSYTGVTLTDAHGAMNDVVATAELFRWFVKRMRSVGKETSKGSEERAKGSEFFEFKCSVK